MDAFFAAGWALTLDGRTWDEMPAEVAAAQGDDQ